jgi:translocation and assembly module TamB
VTAPSRQDQTPSAAPKRLRRAGRLALYALSGAFLLVLSLFTAIQTPPGRTALCRLLERAVAASPGLSARIDGLGGLLPFSIRLERLALMDHAGPWLVVSDVRLDWSLAALVTGRVEIGELSAGIVRLLRPPDMPPDEEPTAMAWPPAVPRLPPVFLDRLAVDRLILDAPVTGVRTETAVSGRMVESGGVVAASFSADRRDGPAAFARLTVRADLANWTLGVALAAEEAPGGPLGAALAPSAAPGGSGPVRVDMKGEGPLADWAGRLSVRVADRPLAETDIALRVPFEAQALASLGLAGYLAPAPGMLPPQAAAVLGERIEFSLSGSTAPGTGAVFLNASRIQAGPATLTFSGRSDPADNTLNLDIALDVPSLAGLSPLTGELGGAFSARLAASGDLDRPTARLTLQATDVATPQAALRAASFFFDITPAADLGGAFPGLSVTGGGRIDGPRAQGGPLFSGHPVVLALDAGLAPDMALALRSLSIVAGGLTLDATAGLTQGGDRNGPQGGRLKADLRVALADLAEVATGFGLPLAGAFHAQAAVDGTPGGGDLTVTLDGGLSGLAAPDRDVPAAVAVTRLLGRTPTFSATARLTGDAADLSAFTLKGEALRLAASGRADLAAETLSATATASLPDLRPLSDVAGRPLRGAVTLEAGVSGRLHSPDATVLVGLGEIKAGEMALSSGDIRLTASDVASRPKGRFAAQAVMGGERLSLEAGFDMPPGRLDVSGLTVAGPGLSLSGDARLDVASGLATGRLSGGSSDLARLGAVLGQSLSGAFTLDAAFAARGGGQDVRASLTGTKLGVSGAAVSSLSLDADVSDVLRAPRGKAALNVSGVSAGGTAVSALEVAATGRDGRGMDVSLKARGRLEGLGALGCDASGRLSPATGGLSLELASLAATVNGLPLALKQKAGLGFAAGRVSVAGLRLGVGKGLVAADGGFDSGKADLRLSLKDLSLAEMAAFGAPGLTGSAQAELRVTGTGARPEAALRATAQGIGLPGGKNGSMPKLSLEASGELNPGGAQVAASVTGLGKTPVAARVRLPARLSLAPFAFELPPDGPLAGNLTADLQLADFAALLAQAGVKAAGRLTADLTASGSLAGPVLGGAAGLSGGSLEYAATGMRLRDIRLDVSASGKTLTLAELSAKDYGKGSLRVSGRADLSPGEGFSLDAAAAFDALAVADMELAKATLSGRIGAAGKDGALAVTGKLFVGPAQVNIPSRLPPDVTQVAVVEVNNPAAPPKDKARDKAKAPGPASDISLDVTVGVGNGVYVRGMGLESEWQGEIVATGTAAAPHLVGGIHTLQGGGIEFFGRRLELVRGRVTFSGGTPPDPELDVEASIAASDATCGVLVSGTAAKPAITLTSNPPLPRDEILARILFGQSAGTITAFQGLQMAQAGAALMSGSGSSLDLLSRTRRLAGLDELDFVPGQGGLETTRLRAAKYLAKGVKVTVDQGAAADSGSVAVEVDITPNISVESKVGADSNQGVGVNWKWDY